MAPFLTYAARLPSPDREVFLRDLEIFCWRSGLTLLRRPRGALHRVGTQVVRR